VITANIDGGARGNPGPAGFGVIIRDADGKTLDELHGALGVATNNVAEYNGLLAALTWAKTHGHDSVHIKADSLLLVEQMRGNYRVKHPGLQPLHARARLLAHEIGRVTFEHVRREVNKDADRLSNLGMDESERITASGSREA
jgi:probable phosphoglycerate mutase